MQGNQDTEWQHVLEYNNSRRGPYNSKQWLPPWNEATIWREIEVETRHAKGNNEEQKKEDEEDMEEEDPDLEKMRG